jgi:hypothetical protein
MTGGYPSNDSSMAVPIVPQNARHQQEGKIPHRREVRLAVHRHCLWYGGMVWTEVALDRRFVSAVFREH